MWKRRTWTTKKGGERQRGRATRRGEYLLVQPLQTNNGSRGLLPLPWTFDYNKTFFGLFKYTYFILFYFFYYLLFSFKCFSYHFVFF
jgi:hypothetical protein